MVAYQKPGVGVFYRVCVSVSAILLALTALWAIFARSWSYDVATPASSDSSRYALWAAGGMTLLFWALLCGGWRQWTKAFSVEALATIGVFSALRVAALYGTRVLGAPLYALLGPLAIFVQGLPDEGIGCLLAALLLVLYPRPGTLTISQLTVFALNAIFMGSIGISSLVFVSVTVMSSELLAMLCGVSIGPLLRTPGSRPPRQVYLRMALALGLGNALKMTLYYLLWRVLYRQVYADEFILAVALVPGLLYGMLGAVAGTWLGYRLREVSP